MNQNKRYSCIKKGFLNHEIMSMKASGSDWLSEQSLIPGEDCYQKHVGPENDVCRQTKWMVVREEKGAKCFFLQVGVDTQKIPNILNKIKFTAMNWWNGHVLSLPNYS